MSLKWWVVKTSRRSYDPATDAERFAEEFLNCDSSCVNDADGDCVCDELEIVGCQDDAAATTTQTPRIPGHANTPSSSTAMATA